MQCKAKTQPFVMLINGPDVIDPGHPKMAMFQVVDLPLPQQLRLICQEILPHGGSTWNGKHLHAISAVVLTYLETAMSCLWKSSLIISHTLASGYIIHMSPITSRMVSVVCACLQVWWSPSCVWIALNLLGCQDNTKCHDHVTPCDSARPLVCYRLKSDRNRTPPTLRIHLCSDSWCSVSF